MLQPHEAGASGRRGSNHAGPSRQNNSAQCEWCDKFGHYEAECRKKKSELAFTSRQLTNYTSNSDYDDRGKMFVMRHKANSMMTSSLVNTSSAENVWLVNSGASYHMTSYEDMFWELRKPEWPDYVETGMKQFTPFNMSIMYHLEKRATKPTSRTSSACSNNNPSPKEGATLGWDKPRSQWVVPRDPPMVIPNGQLAHMGAPHFGDLHAFVSTRLTLFHEVWMHTPCYFAGLK